MNRNINYGLNHYSVTNSRYEFGNGKTIERGRTLCCALGTLSLNDSNTVEEIKEVLENIKSEIAGRTNRDGGERAIFVTTLPNEEKLEKTLEEVGFQMIYTFHRRNYNPEESMLKMWIISW